MDVCSQRKKRRRMRRRRWINKSYQKVTETDVSCNDIPIFLSLFCVYHHHVCFVGCLVTESRYSILLSLSLSLSVFSQSLSLLSSLSTLDDLILLVFALFLPCCFVAEVYLSMVQTEERGKKN